MQNNVMPFHVDFYIVDLSSGMWEQIRVQATAIAQSNSKSVAIAKQKYDLSFGYELEKRTFSDLSEATPPKTIDGTGSLRELVFSDDGNKLLLMEHVNGSDMWKVLDASTLTMIDEPWAIPNGIPTSLSRSAWFGNQPLALYERSDDDGVIAYDVSDGSVLFSLSGTELFEIVLSPDGRWLAVFHRLKGFAEIYASDSVAGMLTESSSHEMEGEMEGEIRDITPRLVPQLSYGRVSGVAISENGSVVAMGDGNGDLILVDTISGREFRRIPTQRMSLGSQIALAHDGSKILVTNIAGHGTIWDVTSGDFVQSLVPYFHGIGTKFVAFLSDGTRTLMCERSECLIKDLSSDSMPIRLQLDNDSQDYEYLAVSLAPDQASVALALGDEGVGWMELNENGRQQIIRVPDQAQVIEVAALGGARVAAGLSNGVIHLIDTARGEITNTIQTTGEVNALTLLGDERLVIASRGKAQDATSGDDFLDIEMLVVSSEDLSVLERVIIPATLSDDSGLVSSLYVDSLVSSSDGHWLVWMWNSDNWSFKPIIGFFDISTLQHTSLLDSRAMPVIDLEFDGDGDYLLVNNNAEATLWDFQKGQVIQQLPHGNSPVFYDKYAALNDNGTLIYITDETLVKSWSIRSGILDLVSPPSDSALDEYTSTLSADGSHIAFGIGSLSNEIYLISHGKRSAKRVNRSGVLDLYINTEIDRVLLDLGEGGFELLDLSSTESIWLRDDIENHFTRETSFTVDRTGVTVRTKEDRLLVLDAGTGETRFSLQNDLGYSGPSTHSVPVVSDIGVQGILRLTGSNGSASRLEHLSLHDASVLDTANLGISSLEFAVSDRDGDVYLVIGDSVVLWDITSGNKVLIDAIPAGGAESVVFSPDGKLMTLAEEGGAVSLWDVSNGTTGLRRLARLITFEDNGWAVVAPDGRYDASDPADLEGLFWVMPDAPTKPVPLTIFYREYYEPRLIAAPVGGRGVPTYRFHRRIGPYATTSDYRGYRICGG